MTKNTRATIWATVAVMALTIGVVTYEKQRPKRPVVRPEVKIVAAASNQTPIVTATEAAPNNPNLVATSTATSTVITKIRKPKPAPIPSYGEMVNTYANTRIQFDSSCRAFPNQMAVANPVTLMLDNRSAGPQKIVIAGKTYNVAAYNYVIVTIKEKILPVHLFANCNSSVNVTEIILE